jgi:hypothetical protein
VEEVVAMKHATEVTYAGGFQQLTTDLAKLRYDALAVLLELLAQKIRQDGDADLGRNRPKLAGHLHNAAEEIAQAWQVCKPFMADRPTEP